MKIKEVYEKYKHFEPIILDLDKDSEIEIYFRVLCDCWKAIKEEVNY